MKVFRIVILFLFIATVAAIASDYNRVTELNGAWLFKVGDNAEWASADFNDANWDRINVPGSWENQGYHGYDGFAWYRKHVSIPEFAEGNDLYIDLGYIDDVDEVYINGRLVGKTGSFYPDFETAYNARRFYTIPQKVLENREEMVIAVRVFDSQLEGGIVKGDMELLMDKFPLNFDISLSGTWHFRLGDNFRWKDTREFTSLNWNLINVPGYWENAGYKNYDGYAWYGIEVTVDESLVGKRMVLMLDKIDDFDQVFINGRLAGSTGFGKSAEMPEHSMYEYTSTRNYILPPDMLKAGKNIIMVRILDIGYDGGMYGGPMGLITHKKFTAYWKNRASFQR